MKGHFKKAILVEQVAVHRLLAWIPKYRGGLLPPLPGEDLGNRNKKDTAACRVSIELSGIFLLFSVACLKKH